MVPSEIKYEESGDHAVKKYGLNKGLIYFQFWWLVLNCLVHPIIGLWPTEPAFKLFEYVRDKITTIEKVSSNNE